MWEERLTRRDALRVGGGTVLAALSGGIAGCGGALPGGDGGTDRLDFVRWLPAPGEIETEGGEALEHYRASFTDLSARRDSDVLPVRENAVYRSFGPAAGVSMADVETLVFSDVAHVLTGQFDAESVADELESGGRRGGEQYPAYSEESTHGAFTFYASGEPVRVFRSVPVVVGVSDGAVVLAPGSGPVEDRTDRSRAVIDAKAGDVDRYAGANEDLDRLVDELGDGIGASVRTHPETEETEPPPPGIGLTRRFEGQVAYGGVTRSDGGEVSETMVKLFASADAVPSDELDAWVEELNDQGGDGGLYRSFSASESGRAWTLTAEIDTSAFSDTPTPTEPGPPTPTEPES